MNGKKANRDLRVVLHFTSDSFSYSSPHLFAIHLRMGEESQDSQPEIYTKGARKPPCVRGEGDYLLGEEQS